MLLIVHQQGQGSDELGAGLEHIHVRGDIAEPDRLAVVEIDGPVILDAVLGRKGARLERRSGDGRSCQCRRQRIVADDLAMVRAGVQCVETLDSDGKRNHLCIGRNRNPGCL